MRSKRSIRSRQIRAGDNTSGPARRTGCAAVRTPLASGVVLPIPETRLEMRSAYDGKNCGRADSIVLHPHRQHVACTRNGWQSNTGGNLIRVAISHVVAISYVVSSRWSACTFPVGPTKTNSSKPSKNHPPKQQQRSRQTTLGVSLPLVSPFPHRFPCEDSLSRARRTSLPARISGRASRETFPQRAALVASP